MLTISLDWERKDGDCTVCSICGEQIFGAMYEMNLKAGEKTTGIPEQRLCEACYYGLTKE